MCQFAGNKSASLRQASTYGIGVIAHYSGDSFVKYSEMCLRGLEQAIGYQMSEKVNDKKEKSTQFHHARDNAIASLGKVLKYQKALIKSNPGIYSTLVMKWLGLLPITHDKEEGSFQYECLGEMVVQEPDVLFGADAQGAVNQVVKIFAEAWQESYLNDTNKPAIANAVRYLNNTANAQFMSACQQPGMSEEMRQRLQQAFNHQ